MSVCENAAKGGERRGGGMGDLNKGAGVLRARMCRLLVLLSPS